MIPSWKKDAKKPKNIVAICVLLLCSIHLSAAWEGREPRFSLSFSGGMNYLTGGGINYFFLQLYPSFKKYASQTQRTLSGRLDPLHWGTDFAGEITIRLERHWALVFGSGFMRSAANPDRDWLDITPIHQASPELQYRFNTAITSVPLTFDLRGSFHLRGRLFLYAGIGPGVYLTHLKNKIDTTLNGNSQWLIQDVKGTAFGAQGSLGLEFRISRVFSLLLEATGRYARCASLTGNSTYSGGEISSGTLYYYKSNGFPNFNVLVAQPSGTGLEDVRKVKANLSGGAVRIGIRFHI
jgi:opacity protein-like surface antigen